MFFLGPLWYAYKLNVLLEKLCSSLVCIALVNGSNTADCQFSPCSKSSCLGAVNDLIVHLLHSFIAVSDIVPDAGFIRDHVGSFPSFQNHIMETIGVKKMLTKEIRGHVHYFNCVEGTAATPWRCSMSGPSFEGENCREHSIPASTIACPESAAAVVVYHRIHIIKQACPYHVWTADECFLGWRAKKFYGSLDSVLIHSSLHGYGCSRARCTHGVVSTTVSWCTFQQRILLRHSAFLGNHGKSIVLSKNCDHRLARAV